MESSEVRTKACSTPAANAQREARTLLIVDDEDGVVYAMRETLADHQFRVIGTTDPARALEILATDATIELLITDLFMPGMDGATLLGRSRRIRPGLGVVLTTGVASDQQLRYWRARGELIILKPWLEQELVEAVQKALSRIPARPPL